MIVTILLLQVANFALLGALFLRLQEKPEIEETPPPQEKVIPITKKTITKKYPTVFESPYDFKTPQKIHDLFERQ